MESMPLNFSSVITAMHIEALVQQISLENTTLEQIPQRLNSTLRTLSALTDTATVPEGRSKGYFLTAFFLLFSRELFVRLRVRSVLRSYGIHRH